MRSKRARSLLIELQVAVKPPDQMADEFDGTTLVRRRRHQLVDKPLGMDPTKRMVADAELACVIGYDHGVGKKAVMTDRAPHRTFAGDPDRVARPLARVDASAARCAYQASSSPNHFRGAAASRSITGAARLRPRK